MHFNKKNKWYGKIISKHLVKILMTNLLIFPKANKNQQDKPKIFAFKRFALCILHNKLFVISKSISSKFYTKS